MRPHSGDKEGSLVSSSERIALACVATFDALAPCWKGAAVPKLPQLTFAVSLVVQCCLLDRTYLAWASPDATAFLEPYVQEVKLGAAETQAAEATNGGYPGLCPDPGEASVVTLGFHTIDDRCAHVWQARVQFDLNRLAEFHVRAVQVAILGYNEQVNLLDRYAPGSCVGAVNLLTPDQSEYGLFNYYSDEIHRDSANPANWDVTGAVDKWLGGVANHGLVLRGYQESLDLSFQGACLSVLNNFTLTLVAEVDPPPAAPAPKPLPNLAIASVQVHDKNGITGCGYGDDNSVAVEVRNSGDAAPPPTDLLLRSYGVEKRLAGAVTAGPGQGQSLVFDHIHMETGTTSVDVTVDPDNKVTEPDNQDNRLVTSVTCASQAATLSVASVVIQNAQGVASKDGTGKPACLTGPNNSIGASIQNTGDTDPGVINVALLVDGKQGATASMGGIGAHSDKLTYFSSVNLKKGDHTLQVVVDPEGRAIKSSLISVNCSASSR